MSNRSVLAGVVLLGAACAEFPVQIALTSVGSAALTPYPGGAASTDVFLDLRLALASGVFLLLFLTAALVCGWIARDAKGRIWTACGASAIGALVHVSLHSWSPWLLSAGARLGIVGEDLVRTPPFYLDLFRTSLV